MNGIIILLCYLAIMHITAQLVSKNDKTASSFFVSNRNLGAVISGASIAATWIWAPALFVSAEKAYQYGAVGLFWFVVPNVACLLLFIPFAKRMREQMPDGITLSGYMYQQYQSSLVQKTYLAQLGALSVLSTAVQLLAGGTVLSNLTGIPFGQTIVILSAVAFSYAHISGIKASVATDMLQMIFILIACAVFVPWAFMLTDGAIVRGLSGATREYTGLFNKSGMEVFFDFGLPTAVGLIAGPFGDQCFWQRTFSINSKQISKAFVIGALLFAVAPLSMGILGLISAGVGFIPTNTGMVNVELVTALFPTWVTVPFLFMLLSGLLSTIDSNLCAFASLTSDLVAYQEADEKEKIMISRTAMLLLLVCGYCVAKIPNITVAQLFLFYGTMRATTLLPTMTTLLGKKLNPNGISLGVICGMLTGLPLLTYGTLQGIAIYKTIGSLTALLTPYSVAKIITIMKEHKED